MYICSLTLPERYICSLTLPEQYICSFTLPERYVCPGVSVIRKVNTGCFLKDIYSFYHPSSPFIHIRILIIYIVIRLEIKYHIYVILCKIDI